MYDKETGQSVIQLRDSNKPPIKFKDMAHGAIRNNF